MAGNFYSTLHEAAVEYALAGYAIFPCIEGDKVPACAGGFKAATTDLNQIGAWFKENPNYNIAFEPGRIGLATVDVERLGLSQLKEFCNGSGPLPKTFYNITPRGGQHLFFNGSVPSIVRPFKGFEIDTRGEGGYVLLPPSRTADGEYKTPDDNFEIADLPKWFSKRIEARKHDKQVAATDFEFDLKQNLHRAKEWLATFPSPVQGERNDKTFKAACRLKDLGCSPETILEMLLEWAPLSDDFTAEEVEGRVASAFSNGQNQPGNDALTGTSKDVFAHIAVTQPKKAETKSRFHMADEEEQDAEPQAEWQIEGILPRRGTVCVYGPSGAYKSFLLLDLALGVASGLPAWGTSTRVQGTVVYGALEGRTPLARERRPAWRLAKGVTGKLPFYVTRAPILALPGEIDEFIKEADKKHKVKPIRLIVFETAAKMLVGLDATRDVPRLIQYCEDLVERYDCTVVVSHHAGHDTEKGPKDSSTYQQGFDNVIAVTTPARGSKISIATVTKFKDFPEPEQPFTFEGKPVGKSLVFQRTTAEQHVKLTKKEDAYSNGNIGAALKALKAVGEHKAIATGILASELHKPSEIEDTEEREATLERATRRLNKLAKTLLAGYCSIRASSKGGVQWFLPE